MMEGFHEVRRRLEPRERAGSASDRAARTVLNIARDKSSIHHGGTEDTEF